MVCKWHGKFLHIERKPSPQANFYCWCFRRDFLAHRSRCDSAWWVYTRRVERLWEAGHAWSDHQSNQKCTSWHVELFSLQIRHARGSRKNAGWRLDLACAVADATLCCLRRLAEIRRDWSDGDARKPPAVQRKHEHRSWASRQHDALWTRLFF